MPRLTLIAAPLAALALFGVADATGGSDAAITRAALAPYRDELLRDAPALCSDLTPPAGATLVVGAPQGASCEQAVEEAFAAAAPPSLTREAALSLRARVSDLRVNGQLATGVFSLIATEERKRAGTPGTAIVSLGAYRLSLQEVSGRWLVSSPAHLEVREDCQPRSPRRCHSGVREILFALGEPVGMVPGEAIPAPAAVKRAGRRERRQFDAGRLVLAQSGCLACHRIDEVGNRGPGPNLTHVGARLSSQQIERAVRYARAPMPSFSRLPARKLRALVRFLSLLR